MDPISHAIFGQTLVTAVGRHPAATRARAVAAVLGALAPDIDAVLMPFGWDLYLRAHEIGTHTIAGSVVLACLVALLVRLFARSSRFADLLWPAWLGCLSHIALDIAVGRTDPNRVAARRRPRQPAAGRDGRTVAGRASSWSARSRWHWRDGVAVAPRWRCSAIVGVFLARQERPAGAGAADARRRQPADAPVLSRVVEARWASLTEWYVFDRQPDRLRQWQIRAGGAPTLLLSWPVVAESPLVAASRSLDTVKNFLAVHDLGFAAEVRQADGGARVLWSDIRYCWRPDARGRGRSQPRAGADRRTRPAGPARLACGLWFGGAFDRDGRPLRQLVKVGGWWQTRAPAR